MNVAMIGVGYVGIASSVGFAELGHTVVGYDVVPERIRALNAEIAPYWEPGLNARLHLHASAGRLRFTGDLDDAVADADFAMIAVGTPSQDDGSADLAPLWDAVETIAGCSLPLRTIVVIRSTVPVGTCDEVARRFERRSPVIYAPEFLREGSAVDDFLRPHRIVVGGDPSPCAVYASLFEALGAPLIVTSRVNAELIKTAANAYLSMKISFANEIANFSEAVEADAETVLRGIGYDRRIGAAFLRAGIGFGGPCFEKDCKSLEHQAERHEVATELVSATLRVNRTQPMRVLEKLRATLGDLRGREIGVWGIAFKADTDDVRDSLAMRVIGELVRGGAQVRAYDPVASPESVPSGCRIVGSALDAANADALLVLTEWPEFRAVPPSQVAERVRSGIVIDGRNVLDAARYVHAGLRYEGMGRALHGNEHRSYRMVS